MRTNNFFYKAFIYFSCLFLIAHFVYGAPPSKQIHILKQSDGSFFFASQWGDECSNGWQTIFGYTVLYDENIGNWVYADKDIDGRLIKTEYVVVKDEPYFLIRKNLRPTPTFLLKGVPGIDEGDEDISGFSPSASYPKTGTIEVPVILVNFNDTATTYTDAEIHDVIFGDGNDTGVKDYFLEVSYNALIFADTDIVDWDAAANGHDYYGLVNGNARAATLVREAVISANAALDFSLFDNNSDGYVDGVVVIHQGPGAEETGHDTDIWSHTWSLSAAAGVDTVLLDGVTIDTYIICPETLFNGGSTKIITIGVFCHEFGHLLGLPNLYDTDEFTQGIGDWGTMSYGLWNEINLPGDSPAHFCAWSKWFLGWVTPTQITTVGRPATATEIKAVEDYDTAIYQFLDNPDTTLDWSPDGTGIGEYFLLENRQAVGFDAALPGTGLLIWHIDESKANNDGYILDVSHKLVDLEEADGIKELDYHVIGDQGDDGDPYPGITNNTDFNLQSDPDNELYDGESSKARVEDIELSDTDILAFIFINEDPALSGPILDPDTGDTETFFEYCVDYLDDDSDTPLIKYLIISDGSTTDTKTMSFKSGTGTVDDGTYQYVIQLNAGEYTYYFSFDDGQGGVVKLPSSGDYSGPIVSGEAVAPDGEDDSSDTEEEEDNSMVQWHCFIATASYGTPMAEEVKVLSSFRDEYLITSPIGRKFVDLYYKTSPPVASFIDRRPLLKKCARGLLKPIVKITETYCYQYESN